jgi:hypothetical protein
MSQLILDDQLDVSEILPELRKWITARRLQDLRPRELIRDDRVPEILLSLKSATFVTIDHGFWDARLCHPDYCILYFALRDDQQHQIPGILRALLRRAEFRSRASRIGKVVRVSTTSITYWEFGNRRRKSIKWRIGRHEG